MRRMALLAVLVALGLGLAGCGGGGGDSELAASVRQVNNGWRARSVAQIDPYISPSYEFDEVDRAGYLSYLAADFADMDTVVIRSYDIDQWDQNYAWVQVRMTAYLNVDVSSVDAPAMIFEWVPTDSTLAQLWVRDYDRRWRIIGEYVKRIWLLRNTPQASELSVLDGDRMRAGGSYTVYGRASDSSTRYKVTMAADTAAASAVGPAMFGWGDVNFSTQVTISPLAYGPYSFYYVAQTDDPSSYRMRGRASWGSYLEVYSSGAPPAQKPQVGKGHGLFAHVRIRHAATPKAGAK